MRTKTFKKSAMYKIELHKKKYDRNNKSWMKVIDNE